MRFFKKNEYLLVIIGALIAVGLSIGLPFVTQPSEQLMPRLTLSQLALSAAALFLMSVALYLTIVQARRAMAKPLIKVAFDEKGGQQTTFIYKDGKVIKALPSPLLINEGNAVARYFQIDFIVPEDIGKQSRYKAIASRDAGKYIVPYTNDGEYTLFVNKPYSPEDTHLTLAIDHNKIMKFPGASFKIEYKVYGDWAETQEGELTVKIDKQGGL